MVTHKMWRWSLMLGYIGVVLVMTVTAQSTEEPVVLETLVIGGAMMYRVQQVACSGVTYRFTCDKPHYGIRVGRGMNWGAMSNLTQSLEGEHCRYSVDDCYVHEKENSFLDLLIAKCENENTCVFYVPSLPISQCNDSLSNYAFILLNCAEPTKTTTETTAGSLVSTEAPPNRHIKNNTVLYNVQAAYCAGRSYEFSCDKPEHVMWVGNGLIWGTKHSTAPSNETCMPREGDCQYAEKSNEFLVMLQRQCNYRRYCWFTIPRFEMSNCNTTNDWVFLLFRCGVTYNWKPLPMPTAPASLFTTAPPAPAATPPISAVPAAVTATSPAAPVVAVNTPLTPPGLVVTTGVLGSSAAPDNPVADATVVMSAAPPLAPAAAGSTLTTAPGSDLRPVASAAASTPTSVSPIGVSPATDAKTSEGQATLLQGGTTRSNAGEASAGATSVHTGIAESTPQSGPVDHSWSTSTLSFSNDTKIPPAGATTSATGSAVSPNTARGNTIDSGNLDAVSPTTIVSTASDGQLISQGDTNYTSDPSRNGVTQSATDPSIAAPSHSNWNSTVTTAETSIMTSLTKESTAASKVSQPITTDQTSPSVSAPSGSLVSVQGSEAPSGGDTATSSSLPPLASKAPGDIASSTKSATLVSIDLPTGASTTAAVSPEEKSGLPSSTARTSAATPLSPEVVISQTRSVDHQTTASSVTQKPLLSTGSPGGLGTINPLASTGLLETASTVVIHSTPTAPLGSQLSTQETKDATRQSISAGEQVTTTASAGVTGLATEQVSTVPLAPSVLTTAGSNVQSTVNPQLQSTVNTQMQSTSNAKSSSNPLAQTTVGSQVSTVGPQAHSSVNPKSPTTENIQVQSTVDSQISTLVPPNTGDPQTTSTTSGRSTDNTLINGSESTITTNSIVSSSSVTNGDQLQTTSSQTVVNGTRQNYTSAIVSSAQTSTIADGRTAQPVVSNPIPMWVFAVIGALALVILLLIVTVAVLIYCKPNGQRKRKDNYNRPRAERHFQGSKTPVASPSNFERLEAGGVDADDISIVTTAGSTSAIL